MSVKQEPESRTLERGDIYFVYTPRVHSPGEETDVEGLEDIERTYMILSVRGTRLYRRIVVGFKRMPDVERGGEPALREKVSTISCSMAITII